MGAGTRRLHRSRIGSVVCTSQPTLSAPELLGQSAQLSLVLVLVLVVVLVPVVVPVVRSSLRQADRLGLVNARPAWRFAPDDVVHCDGYMLAGLTYQAAVFGVRMSTGTCGFLLNKVRPCERE